MPLDIYKRGDSLRRIMQVKEKKQLALSHIAKPLQTSKIVSAGINGFGRVGKRLFRHWLLHQKESAFTIKHVNDAFLTVEDVACEIKYDSVLGEIPNKVEISSSRTSIVIDGSHEVFVSSCPNISDIPWDDSGVEWVFECTGKYTEKAIDELVPAAGHLAKVEKVIISATSLDADHMIVLGVNHDEYHPKRHAVVSYGSCTVNAYVPIANLLHREFGIVDASVHVTHGMPEKEITKLGAIKPIKPRECTLEYAGPHLLPFLKDANFYVSYHLVPTPTASIMEMEFTFQEKDKKSVVSAKEVLKCLEAAVKKELDLHLGIAYGAHSSNEFIGNEKSIIIDADSIRRVGTKILLRGWFDNEHSIIRAYDLAHYMLSQEV